MKASGSGPAPWRSPLLAGVGRTLSRVFLAALLLLGRAGAQDLRDLARPAFRSWGAEAGLSTLTIQSLMQDSRGQLWLGTTDGVFCFSGKHWTPLPLPPGARSFTVRSLVEGHEGTLWMGTEAGGIWAFKEGRWTLHDRGNGLPTDGINTLLETRDEDGAWSLWAGTRGAGVARWKAGRWTEFGPREGLASDWVWKLRAFPDPQGRMEVWAAGKGGVHVLRQGRWQEVRPPAGFPWGEASDLLQVPNADGTASLWVTQWKLGIARCQGGKWTAWGGEGFPGTNTTSLALSTGLQGEPALWAGTWDRGLLVFQDGVWRQFSFAQGFPAGGMFALMANPAGKPSLWVGSRGFGLISVDPYGWWTLDEKGGLPSQDVTSFAEWTGPDGAPQLWVGTNQGVVRRVKDRWAPLGTQEAFRRMRVMCLLPEGDPRDPDLWAGTLNGLAYFHRGRWRLLATAEGLTTDMVKALLRTRGPEGRSRLWVGTQGRLYVREGPGAGPFREASPPSIQDFNDLKAVVSQGQEEVWAALRSQGVARLRAGQWNLVNTGLPNPATRALLVTASGNGRRWLWVTTEGANLSRLDLDRPDGEWETWALPSTPATGNGAFRMEMDPQGRMYLGTAKGVLRLPLDPQTGTPRLAQLETFTQGDGLPPMGWVLGQASKVDSRHRIWFATARGAAVLDPFQAPSKAPLPSPALVRVRVDGQVLPGGAAFEVRPRAKRLHFEFTLPFYHRTEDTAFRTQLVGLEEEPGPWNPEGFREVSGLGPGRYRLQIWARAFDGRITGPVELGFRILPPPWKTWWAFGLYGLALAFGVAATVRGRTRRFQAQALALEQVVLTRTREMAEALQEATAAKALAEAEREDARRARQEAETATRAKSEFLANMSHEIRTPMNAVLGFSRLGVTLDDLPKARAYFQKITASGQALLGLINDILDFSKVEAGRLELEAVPFRLDATLALVRDLLIQRAQEKGVELHLDLSPAVPLGLVGDPLRLGQVLLNLAGNALKFTERGQVQIHVAPVRTPEAISELTEKVELRFSVQDTGIGMSVDQQTRLFHAFAQADASTTRKFGGTGLGLTISQRLVRLMGGEISVDSAPGRGSTFAFTVPFHVAEVGPAQARREEEASATLRGARILLVEDNAINQEVAREILQGAGLQVDVAWNGLEAIRMVDHTAYDAVLMDVQMPEMDGYDATARIREKTQHAALPIIAMTAHAMAGYREECLAAGMNDYVSKPIEPQDLFAVLDRWISPQQAQRRPGSTPAQAGAVEPSRPEAAPPAFDLARGLRRLGGNRALYFRLVSDLGREFGQAGEEVRRAVERRDWSEAERWAHTVRGVAGNLSAGPLAAAAGALEQVLRDQDPRAFESAFKAFEGALALALDEARALLAQEGGQPEFPA